MWTPGMAGPHDEFVRNLLAQAAGIGDEVSVSIELSDGSLFHLISISPRPGFGFITVEPHPEEAEPTQVVVPIASIAQIRIGKAEPHLRAGFGFVAPEAPEPA